MKGNRFPLCYERGGIRMKYVLIGCGRISPNHIQAARNNGLKIAALCDLDQEAAIRLIRQFELEGVAVYTDHHTMLEREHPDLVAIATDSGSHARIALDCLEAGSHVLIEKPMALSLQEADQIIDTARACGLQVGVCHQNRFNRSVQYIRKAMEAGRFGKLSHGTAHIRWNRSRQYYDQAPWRGTWAQDGGCLMNQGIHSADLLRWMMGENVEEVMACTSQRQHPYIEGEDLALAIIRFAGGACATLECTTNVYPCNLEETLYLFGEKGTVKAGGISDNIIEHWAFADGLDDSETVKAEYGENPPDIYGYGHTPLYADLLEAIRTQRPCLVDGRSGRQALELVLAIYQSAATGQPVTLPLKQGSTLDFAGRFDRND